VTLIALALCLSFLWGLKLFRTGEAPFRSFPVSLWHSPERTPERVRSGGIQVMMLAMVGLVVLAVVTFG
jgi:hypothetical protein